MSLQVGARVGQREVGERDGRQGRGMRRRRDGCRLDRLTRHKRHPQRADLIPQVSFGDVLGLVGAVER